MPKTKQKNTKFYFISNLKKGDAMVRKLRMMLFIASLVATPFSTMDAKIWQPLGDECIDDYAFTGGEYKNGDRFIDPTQTPGPFPVGEDPIADGRTSFTTSAGDNQLKITGKLNGNGVPCPLKIDGDVELNALTHDMEVEICSDVIFQPYVEPVDQVEETEEAPVMRSTRNGGNVPGNGFAQMYFNVASGRKITVKADHNMEWRAYNPVSKTRSGKRLGPEGDFIDMIVTFAGQGQVAFEMADGTSIKFNGEFDPNGAVSVLDGNAFDQFSNDAGGTKVFITMEQTEDEVNNGINKVTFKRQNFADESNRCLVMVGHNSVITYVSTDVTGLQHTLQNNPVSENFASVAFDPSNQGAGRMILLVRGAYEFGWEFGDCTPEDPEFYQIRFFYPYNDGAVVVAGHKVDDYDPESIRCTLNYSIPAGGVATFRVCDDMFYQNEVPDESADVTVDPIAADRRGLLVVNDVQGVSNGVSAASNPYCYEPGAKIIEEEEEELVPLQNLRQPGKWKKLFADKIKKFKEKGLRSIKTRISLLDEEEEAPPAVQKGLPWTYSFCVEAETNFNNVRRGFWLGVNGKLDVYHNNCFDYVAGSVNKKHLLAECDFSNGSIMGRNPAAFIVDGLDPQLFAEEVDLSDFQAANPFRKDIKTVRAQISLHGTGKALFRCSGSSLKNVCYIFDLWTPIAPFSDDEEEEEEEVFNRTTLLTCDMPDFDWDGALLIDANTAWDGCTLEAGQNSNKKGKGQHVLEVEGELDVKYASRFNDIDPRNELARKYDDEDEDNPDIAAVSMPTIEIDHTCAEVDTRPLVRGNTYNRYNSPSMFFNNHANFFGSRKNIGNSPEPEEEALIVGNVVASMRILHSDVTKCITGVPSCGYPAIVGGERLFFSSTKFVCSDVDRERFRWPEIRLFNAEIALQESLASAGVRYVVKDIPGFADESGSNYSILRFYDHGDVNDTNFLGHGRIFQLGSKLHYMCDSKTNWATEGCYFNVFKCNKTSDLEEEEEGDQDPAMVTLSYRNGDQFPAEVSSSEYDHQRAHHLYLMSIMPKGATNTMLGWPTINADCSQTSFPYANSRYPDGTGLEETDVPDVAESPDSFRLSVIGDELTDPDSTAVPAATASIDGHFICFGGFDCDGNKPRCPITRQNNQAIYYVNHGGRLTITRPFPETGEEEEEEAVLDIHSIPFETVIDTVVAQKVWDDFDATGEDRAVEYTGRVDLPHDQTTFTNCGSVQPWCFSEAMFDFRRGETDGMVRLGGFFNEFSRNRADRSGAEEVTINWFNRQSDNSLFVPPTPLRSIGSNATVAGEFYRSLKRYKTRATESIQEAIPAPDNLLYIGPGDDIKQLRVAGATQSDPFMLGLFGDPNDPLPGRVREFVTLNRTLDMKTGHMVGEGDHAMLFFKWCGRAGLGSRDWDGHSGGRSWSRIGKDHVQIVGMIGGGTIDLNSRVLITDRQAILASTSFNSAFDEENEDEGDNNKPDRLNFHAEVETEIRVRVGGELDFSSFTNGGEVAFTGHTHLVLEPGVTVRLPENPAKPFSLVFEDEARLVIEGTPDPCVSHGELADYEADTVKVVGVGRLKFDDDSRADVYGSHLAVRSDAQTPITNLKMEIRDAAKVKVGSEGSEPSGVFTIGNPFGVDDGSIKFELEINGPDALFEVGEHSVWGIAAMPVDAIPEDRPLNGNTDPDMNPVLMSDGSAMRDENDHPVFTPAEDGMKVVACCDVEQVRICVKQGDIHHREIADGDSIQASLMVLGPIEPDTEEENGDPAFIFETNGQDSSTVCGGANVMLLKVDEEHPQGTEFSVNVHDYAGENSDGTRCSILASAPLLIDREFDLGTDFYETEGRCFEFDNSEDAYNFLAFRAVLEQVKKRVVGAKVDNDISYAFTNMTPGDPVYNETDERIVRDDNPPIIEGDPKDSVLSGTFEAHSDGDEVDPVEFSSFEHNPAGRVGQ